MTVDDEIKTNPKVSIIVPMYNAVKTLKETIDTVLTQTYIDWELILVDDCSTDNTKQFAEDIARNDSRIKVYQMSQNGGPGAATKFGFEKATGGIIAFLDSDDLWVPEKLQKQIDFMIQNNYDFVCSDYIWIDENDNFLNRKIKCKPIADYKTVLKSCPVGSSTVVITKSKLSSVEIPSIRKDNDYALWLKLLRDGSKIYGINEVLMKYRILPTSVSFNKRKKIKYHWEVYRRQEGFNIIKSAYLLNRYIFIKILGIK